MMIVDLILLKNRNFARTNLVMINHRNVIFAFILFAADQYTNFPVRPILIGICRVPEVCVSYRLLQTVLFLTDSVFRVLFAYFDESMASKLVYKP